MSDDKITRLSVSFKPKPGDDEPFLKVVSYRDDKKCNHKDVWEGGKYREVNYSIREGETEVECNNCGTRLDPMFVLILLANRENGYRNTQHRYAEEMNRLANRSRTTCQHCGKMTKISRS